MQEFDFNNLEFESDLTEPETDQESERALDNFLKSLNIKNGKDIPALKQASEKTKKILKKFCESKNTRIRTQKVVEFYKCLDWIPYKELDKSIFDKLPDKERKQVFKDVNIYLHQKEDKLSKKSEWQQEYRNRVFTYYKQNVPKNIKLELERLRDYELNLVGHDRNWQYYFQLNSFKKIDEFVSLTYDQRLDIFYRFKKDVMTYKMNRDRNIFNRDRECENCSHRLEDDIDKSINWEKSAYKHYKNSLPPGATLDTDYKTLGLPSGTAISEIKKQYRKLAMKYHPDKPGGDELKMKAIVSAYHRLINK